MDRHEKRQEQGGELSISKLDAVKSMGALTFAVLGSSAFLGLTSYATVERSGEVRMESDLECVDPAGLMGELNGAGYRDQEDVDVTIELVNGARLQMPSGTEFEVQNAVRGRPTLNPDGESVSYSTLTIAIENDTYDISEASVKAGWVDVEGLDSREIDEITLCQLKNGAPRDDELVVMAGSKQD